MPYSSPRKSLRLPRLVLTTTDHLPADHREQPGTVSHSERASTAPDWSPRAGHRDLHLHRAVGSLQLDRQLLQHLVGRRAVRVHQRNTDFVVRTSPAAWKRGAAPPPTFDYIYVPITAGGIAFMYNVPGLTKTSSSTGYTTCAILTGGITNWDNSQIAAANPGVTLPNLAIRPVTESDPAGTNYVLEEWCIDEQHVMGLPATTRTAIRATRWSITPTVRIQWPAALLANGLDADLDGEGGQRRADQSWAASPGAPSTRSTPIDAGNFRPGGRLEYNASGDYAQPTSVNTARAGQGDPAAQRHPSTQLQRRGAGPYVYTQPSYLLTPTEGWQAPAGSRARRESMRSPWGRRSHPASATPAWVCRSNGTVSMR